MHHQNTSRPIVTPVEFVREAKVERQMVFTVGVQLSWPNSIKSFRALSVAFSDFRSEGTGMVTDGIGLEKLINESLASPYFQLFFFFENSDENRIAKSDIHVLHFTNQSRGNTSVCFLGGFAGGYMTFFRLQLDCWKN